MTDEHVILVAFQVRAGDEGLENESRADVMGSLMEGLKELGPLGTDNVFGVECWWVAEDDRTDGSDNDSAVFVHPGKQKDAVSILHDHGCTAECNLNQGVNTEDNPWEEADA